MPSAQISLWLVLGVALLISVVTDVLHQRILDAITYPTVLVALGMRLLHEGVGGLERGLLSGLFSAAALLAIFSVLAWRGRMGWGDAKLMAAVGAALGYPLVIAALVFISLVGALQAVVTLMWRAPSKYIPYGVAIALGSFWAMLWERSGMR